jgi:hypothetical protein
MRMYKPKEKNLIKLKKYLNKDKDVLRKNLRNDLVGKPC